MPSPTPSSDPREVLLEIYAVNDAMNQLLLAHLDPRAWRALPPGQPRNGHDHRSHLRPPAQQPAGVAQTFRSALKMSRLAQPRPLHA